MQLQTHISNNIRTHIALGDPSCCRKLLPRNQKMIWKPSLNLLRKEFKKRRKDSNYHFTRRKSK